MTLDREDQILAEVNSKKEFKTEPKVEYKPKEEVKKIVKKDKLELTLNDNNGLLNGIPVNMTPSPYTEDGHIWVPYDLVCKFLNEEMKLKDGVLTIEGSN
jgi:hypothetical protein